MTDPIDKITLEGGKYTVELGVKNGRFSFTALRHGEPWRDMSSDGDNLMLAMFQKIREQKEQIAKLERGVQAPLQRTLRRWDVEDGSTEPVEAEPTYTMTMDADRGLLEIRPAGLNDEQLDGVPQLLVMVEIMKGLPRLLVHTDILGGEVEAQFVSLPDGRLVDRLYATPDIQAIGEQIRSRAAAPSEFPESNQAPRV
ncbi:MULTISPECIES: hypothetical protein [unclassified Variovorax]|uniref:hypothetical protein n=1 Tax=unclassified Variovorax TaxID=663243 RepID=UPI00076D650D|nr:MULTISPECIES: hypothetical protein [unclassified Variovorax]KWT65075.1 hypothetical protein APY03_7528 [Variovorax sp. WDL1]PNG49053.1 hypothetical protein CHC06_06290 [Variovorax sp. B2]PNG49438.1 hypothetical protein CHC07_06347 [Variovorax sp. B4]VTV18942.1 hypothetical protein WDL1P2_00550 [Variovorax sp. WDL1]